MSRPGTKLALLTYTGLALVQRSMSLLLLPFVTRAMSIDEYGMVSILSAIGMFLSVSLGAAVEQAVFRSAARVTVDPTQRPVLSAAAAWLLVAAPVGCLMLALTIVAIGSPVLHTPANYVAIEVAAAGLGLFPGMYVIACLRAQERLGAFVTVSLVSIFVGVGSKMALVVVAGLGAKGWVLTDLMTAALTLAVGLVFVRPQGGPRTPSDAMALARFALPLVPHVLSFWALAFLSRPLMATVLPLSAVGEFSVAFNAANVGMLLVSEVNRAVSVDYATDSLPAPSDKTAQIIRLQLWLALVAPLLVCTASRPFVAYVVPSSAYAEVVPLLALLCAAPFFWTVYVLAINILVLTAGRPGWNWIASVSGTVVMAVGTIWLGSIWGVQGVAFSQVACYAVMAVVSHALVRRLRLEVDWRRAGLTPMWFLGSLFIVCLAAVGTYAQIDRWLWVMVIGAANLSAFSWGFWLYRGQAPVRSPRALGLGS